MRVDPQLQGALQRACDGLVERYRGAARIAAPGGGLVQAGECDDAEREGEPGRAGQRRGLRKVADDAGDRGGGLHRHQGGGGDRQDGGDAAVAEADPGRQRVRAGIGDGLDGFPLHGRQGEQQHVRARGHEAEILDGVLGRGPLHGIPGHAELPGVARHVQQDDARAPLEREPASGCLRRRRPQVGTAAFHQRGRRLGGEERVAAGRGEGGGAPRRLELEVEAAGGGLQAQDADQAAAFLAHGGQDGAVAGRVRVRQRGDQRQQPVAEQDPRRAECGPVVLPVQHDRSRRLGPQYRVDQRERGRFGGGRWRLERPVDHQERAGGSGEKQHRDRRRGHAEPLAAQVDRPVEDGGQRGLGHHSFDACGFADQPERERGQPAQAEPALRAARQRRLLPDQVGLPGGGDGQAARAADEGRLRQRHRRVLAEPGGGQPAAEAQQQRASARRGAKAGRVDDRDRQRPGGRRDGRGAGHAEDGGMHRCHSERRGLGGQRDRQHAQLWIVGDRAVVRGEVGAEPERGQPSGVARVEHQLGTRPDREPEASGHVHDRVASVLAGAGTSGRRRRRGVRLQGDRDPGRHHDLGPGPRHWAAEGQRPAGHLDAGPGPGGSAAVEQLAGEPHTARGHVIGDGRRRRAGEVDEDLDRQRQERHSPGHPDQADLPHDREQVDPDVTAGEVAERPQAAGCPQPVGPGGHGARGKARCQRDRAAGREPRLQCPG